MNSAIKYNIPENGEVIDLARAKLSHNRVLSRLVVAFSNAVKEPCEVFREQSYRWDIDTAAYRMPDISIICNASSKNEVDIDNVPWFVLEVLSASTEKAYRNEKMILYARVGVKEYWILDPDTLDCEMYLNNEGSFEIVKKVNLSASDEIRFLSKDVAVDIRNIKL